ncbi:MAG: FGGY family carbohydrate kinase [Candidatus Latescibacteria bacterium]|jgi:xylulokinase|nr:FGGY family carbohydrate kinase [Candidatus Latescibacterota bacterium]
MADTPLIAGIDFGTTNTKALVFDPTGRIVSQASVRTPTHRPRPGWAHYRPDELWDGVVQVLRGAIGRLQHPKAIVSVAVASVGETGVPIDSRGEPTYDAIAWFDQRTESQAEHLERTVGSDRFHALTGLPVKPIFGLCKMLWLKEHEPDAFARTAAWLNAADYIAYRLCGTPATDHSLASRTLALDLHRLQWAEDVVSEAGIPSSLLAPLVASGTPLGNVLPEMATETGLPTSAQVAAGGHDHICGALAVGVTEPDTLLDSLGTAEALCIPLNSLPIDTGIIHDGYSLGAHVVPGRYYVLGGIYTSGASIEWFRDALGGDAEYEELIAEAGEVPPGSLGACFLPHLRLGNPPHNDPLSRGAFIGLTPDVSRGGLFRALLEGLALEYRYLIEGLVPHLENTVPTRIVSIGGGTRNALLMGIKASVQNRTITVAEVDEAVALGAAVLGGLAAGVYSDVPSALSQLRIDQTRVDPVPEMAELYETRYQEVFRHLYSTLRPLHRTLAQSHGQA